MVTVGLALLTILGWSDPTRGPQSVPGTLVGSWRLVAYEDRPSAGSPVFPFGKNPKGLLIYSSTGQMSIQIMKQPHPRVASGDEEKVTPEEKQTLFDSFMAYFGTYSVEPTRGVVIHHVEGDLWGVFDGKAEERPFELSGDRLTLKPEWDSGGRHWLGIRAFERVRSRGGGAQDARVADSRLERRACDVWQAPDRHHEGGLHASQSLRRAPRAGNARDQPLDASMASSRSACHFRSGWLRGHPWSRGASG